MVFLGGQFKSATHGQFKSAQGGHFDRILHKNTFPPFEKGSEQGYFCLKIFHLLDETTIP